MGSIVVNDRTVNLH